jgi:hypothetical protein
MSSSIFLFSQQAFASSPQADPTYGWTSVSAVYSEQQNVVLANINYLNGKTEILSRFPQSAQPHFYGVSADGLNVLVGLLTNNQYRILVVSRANRGGKEVFSQPYNRGDSALWLRDSHTVLVSSAITGITRVDTNTGQRQQLLRLPFAGETQLGKLQFIYNDYLYFIGAGKNADRLARVHLNGTGRVEILTGPQPDTLYWLSPTGAYIYYRNAALGSPLLAVNTQSGRTEQYRSGVIQSLDDWFPAGFGPQNTLLVIRRVGLHFQLLDTHPFTKQPPKIVAEEVAPGSVGIGSRDAYKIAVEENVAVAPYGHAVVVQAMMADGRSKLWSTNLLNSQLRELPMPSGDRSPAHLLGWNKMAV